MHYIELIALFAVSQYLLFGAMTGNARRKSGLAAPAISGSVEFEKMYRVQMNTLEMLVAFLPALFVAGQHQNPVWMAAIGCVYLVGRFIYWRAYISNPSSRTQGFMLTLIPIVVLAALAIFSVVNALLTEFNIQF
ncbi:MAPEG family protein [Paraglaciecola sp.]|uniref:MAPEG family protein n=1 Tax=Paraglaciecola sp. TaxID=1920173 RepID=UPI003266F553